MLSNVSSLMEEVPKQKGEKTEHPDTLEKRINSHFSALYDRIVQLLPGIFIQK